MQEPAGAPQFSEVNAALDNLDAEVDAPEGHGLLCGMLSAGGEIDDRIWLSQVLPVEEKKGADANVLRELYAHTVFQLEDPEFSFSPLLPVESNSLATRTEALSRWCSGFLCGLGLSGVKDVSALPDDVAEVLADLAKIAGVDYEIDEAGEAEERAYTEVVEYVRVGALLIFESLRRPPPDVALH